MIRSRHQQTFQGFVVATTLTATALVFAPLLDATGVPLTAIMTGAIGLILQALPFLIIGVLISSAIETFLTQDFIEHHFPRHAWGGMLIALAAGFCMPVCDCATVPVFARMLHKRIPLGSAVVFLCAAPIINPVVIWSTWFAFPDKPLVTVLRVALGIVIALAVGGTFLAAPERGMVLREETFRLDDGIETASRTDRYHGHSGHDSQETGTTGSTVDRITAYLRHAHDDLFQVMPYMLTGIILASVIHVLSANHAPAWLSGHGQLPSIAIMMLLAFLSSLCSTSDAVIARSLASLFPTSALLGFLTFGPIMDVKNVLMLSSMFTRRFVVRLGVTVALTCLVTTGLLSLALGGLGL